jgi:hypothetical protein
MPSDVTIDIGSEGGHRYAVTLRSTRQETVHQVTVPAQLLEDLAVEAQNERDLVQASFVFLLEREPPSSILRRFDLDVIGQYFPEYMDTIRRRLGSGRAQP